MANVEEKKNELDDKKIFTSNAQRTTTVAKGETIIELKDVTIRFNKNNLKVDNLKEYFIRLVTKQLMFQEFIALKDINLDIKKGEAWGFLGTNGAGKSTLIRMVNALERPTSGKIFVEDKDIGSLSAKELRSLRKGIGMIFQQFNLLESKTIYDNVAIALKLNGTPKKDIEARVNELMEFVELSDKKSYYPGQLSGGQKQRVGIARALANNPSILLCDEATSALDPKTTDSILDLLKKINETLHITIVIITHEMNVIQKICNKVAVMDFGKVVETGSVIQVFSDPQSDIAKRFVGNLIHDVIPEPLVESIRRETRNSRLLRIKLENTDSTEPLLWDINRRFEVETNILYSTINVIQGIVVGIMLVLFIGSDEEIKKAERYILESNEEYKEVVLP